MPEKTIYLSSRPRAALQQAGKPIVYADESDFRDESYRRYGYARKGETV